VNLNLSVINHTTGFSVSHQGVCSPFFCLISFSFLHLMKRKEESMADRPRKKLQRSQDIWRIFEKLREIEDDLFSSRSPSIYRQMNKFIAINTSLENTRAPEKSAYIPRRSTNRKDGKLTVATNKPL